VIKKKGHNVFVKNLEGKEKKGREFTASLWKGGREEGDQIGNDSIYNGEEEREKERGAHHELELEKKEKEGGSERVLPRKLACSEEKKAEVGPLGHYLRKEKGYLS